MILMYLALWPVRLVLLAVISLIYASFWVKRFSGQSAPDDEQYNYAPPVSPLLVPIAMLIYLALELIYWKSEKAIIAFCMDALAIMVPLAAWSILAYFLIKPLRKVFCASSCSLLWLAPNFAFVLVILRLAKWFFSSRFSVEIDKGSLAITVPVYFSVCALLFILSIIRHLRFRKYVLTNAVLVDDERILGIFTKVLQETSKDDRTPRIVISPDISTALSLGVFRKSTVVLLPDKNYSDEDLELILRHELIHILRQDPVTKLFMVFCCSLLWIDPFMWMNRKLASEDIELSCDEAVLSGLGDDTKERYADLVLSSAGDDRGFSTSLSSSAKSLKYRLSGIMNPAEKRSGVLLIAAAIMLAAAGTFLISFSAKAGTAGSEILPGYDEGKWKIVEVYGYTGDRLDRFVPSDETEAVEVLEKMMDLEVSIEGGSTYYAKENGWHVKVSNGNDYYILNIYGRRLRVSSYDRSSGVSRSAGMYYISDLDKSMEVSKMLNGLQH